MMRKLFKQLHIWLSMPLGIVMSITCFTGAMLIFEDEITRSAQSDIYYVAEVHDEPMSFAELVATLEPTLLEGQAVESITTFDDAERSYEVVISGPDGKRLHVDQYTGEVLGTPKRIEAFRTIFRLHRWLMDSRPSDGGVFWGKMVVGISTLLMVVVILTGVVIWWPKSMKMWLTRSKVSLKLGWHRFWYDLHVVGGIYATLLLLVMALTGLTWSFEWYRTGFYRVLGNDAPAGKHTKPGKAETAESDATTIEYAVWQRVYDELGAKYADAQKIMVSNGKATVTLSDVVNKRASDSYTFDTASGEIVGSELYAEREKSRRIRGAIYSIHVGNFGGILTRVLWFMAALLGAVLPITGYYMWIKRKFFKKQK